MSTNTRRKYPRPLRGQIGTKGASLEGIRIGYLVCLVDRYWKNERGAWFGLFRCDCGKEVKKRLSDMRQANKPSCGCQTRRQNGEGHKKHGMWKSRVYKTWQGMKARCSTDDPDRRQHYKDRGIKVCERWMSFDAFYADMGDPPTNKHTIDRIDVNGDYEPGNCRWATVLEQNNNKTCNRKYFWDGKWQTIAELARSAGFSHSMLSARFDAGWTTEEAMTIPYGHHVRKARRLGRSATNTEADGAPKPRAS